MQGGGVDIYITVTIEIPDNSIIQSQHYYTVLYMTKHCTQNVKNVTNINAPRPQIMFMD